MEEVDLVQLKEEPLNVINGDIEKDPLAIEETNLVKSENLKVENERIMNGLVNNTFINEAIPLNKDIKLETDQENVAEMICFYLPHHTTETDASVHEVDSMQLKEEPLDVINGDIEKDPLAIEETDFVKLENLKVENERVIIDKGTDKGSTKNRITQKRCVNKSVYDGIIKEKSIEYNQSCNLKSQLNIHTKMKNYDCNFCQKRFRDISYLKMHINLHTKEKNYVCKFCQKSFNFRRNLMRHLKKQTNKKNYICNFCHKSLNSECCLKIHLATHMKEKNYVCKFCQKSFNIKSNLTTHLNIHKNERNYVCNFCQMSFNCKSYLNRHLHTKEKNYDNSLVLFTKFLVKTVEEKNFTESVLDIEAFKKSFSSLDNYYTASTVVLILQGLDTPKAWSKAT
ncbi:uncharacterized protein LOC142328376 [Lycorma delicatula]|uniref:uncharacterized protein LOC142328376 n=1 Tax=Lycorma delicatula TaxID=130591 RepID=UPI003F51464C